MMAHSTTTVVKNNKDTKAQVEQQLAEALHDNAEGVVQALGLLQDLEERGVLPLSRALIEQAEDVLNVILALFQREEYAGGLKNLIGLAQLLTAIPHDSLQKALSGISGGLKEAGSAEPKENLGVYGALSALRDPDVSRAVSFIFSFLKGMGKTLEGTDGAEAKA